MNDVRNDLGQPIGFPVPNWQPRPLPPSNAMVGRYCRVEPLDPAIHGEALHRANREDSEQRIWTYLPYGPFKTLTGYLTWVEAHCQGSDPQFHAIVDLASASAVGVASYLRIDYAQGVIEVGHINYSPRLQKTTAATEAMFLMMRRVFDELGYRRYEWKCDALNSASRRAAERLGFGFEGVFRQATMYKGRNRDTAWYAILDCEWPALRESYERWLDPSNFESDGSVRIALAELIRQAKAGVNR